MTEPTHPARHLDRPSTKGVDPFAAFPVDELEAAIAWHRGARKGEPPAPILAFVEWRLTAQEYLTPEEAVAVATLTNLELRGKILDRAYARGTA